MAARHRAAEDAPVPEPEAGEAPPTDEEALANLQETFPEAVVTETVRPND